MVLKQMAARFAGSTELVMRLATDGAQARIVIYEKTNEQVAQAAQPAVFRAISNPAPRRAPGYTVALYVANALVTAHHGMLEMTDDPERPVLRISLPLHEPAGADSSTPSTSRVGDNT
jgi:nitrogen-specific signal transduction histidine kinase